ncbi:hypothetical protein AncyloWKF20_18280 [Ancylobacter sp. WKF20]|uniref:hypothetical protein n=1 Tax=Ancylobacter sp. WKF20 TaxID=3039801 RepID=UPI002434257A|nr:hypothetical protein [Ancylobacter sp. WKF20]WGD29686.1 hypothetical protein AncyloWKF20_18280 [Ancylobacter sp. WKF20]
MAAFDLAELRDDSFVIHFGGEAHDLDAETFSNTLLALAATVEAINSIINPGFSAELRVEEVGPGSFRVRLRKTTASLKNLFSDRRVEAIILSLVASLLYDALKGGAPPPVIVVNTNEVIVEYQGNTVVVPRVVYEAKAKVEKSTEVRRGLTRTIEAVEKDPRVYSFGITADLSDPVPLIEIPRAKFLQVKEHLQPLPDTERRFVDEETRVVVHKAVFEKSGRKWEFIWQGRRISAPISDMAFFDSLKSRTISIAQGDTFDAVLRIYQSRDPFSGVWMHDSYEIVRMGTKVASADPTVKLDI